MRSGFGGCLGGVGGCRYVCVDVSCKCIGGRNGCE